MTVSVAILGCGVLVVLAVYKVFLYPVFLSSLAKIPAANFSARFSPLWINYIRWANLENNTLYQLHQRLGPIVRLGPNELSVDCYEGGLKTICKCKSQDPGAFSNQIQTQVGSPRPSSTKTGSQIMG